MRLLSFVTGNAAISGYPHIAGILFRGQRGAFPPNRKGFHSARAAWLGTLLMVLYSFLRVHHGCVHRRPLFAAHCCSPSPPFASGAYLSAGIFGFLAAFTRTQGMLLLAPALYEWIVSPQIAGAGWFVFLIPLGFGAYLLLNRVLQGSFFRFLEHQAAPPWYHTTKWVSENLAQHFGHGAGLSRPLPSSSMARKSHCIFLTACGPVLWLVARHAHLLSRICAAYLIFTYFSGWMISGGRYMLGCVPLFLIAADIKSARAGQLLPRRQRTALCPLYVSVFTGVCHHVSGRILAPCCSIQTICSPQ